MFAYNKPCEMKDGKVVVPILKEGDRIVCLDGDKTVYYKKEDFITKKEKKTKVVEAVPLEKEPEIKEQEPVVVELKDEIVIKQEEIIQPTIEVAPPVVEVAPKPQKPKPPVKKTTIEEQIIKRKDNNTRGEYI